ncbi:hypothetical protein L1D37_11785 [Vibrio sp. Isolate33]|uniref:hypothetical protein n=1 Tax=Vibrio sp. Isolate33 TaxID=2908539 RepID=UPI001EFE3812|nr:hypothetical protein [Vibrio sp. Isolate33]MCG9544448.1 hypothetical protein [Vibrio sp. Isolate33]
MSKRLLAFFSYTHGMGGHCVSITTLYDEFKKHGDVELINLGFSESALNSIRDGRFYSLNDNTTFSIIRSLVKYVKREGFDEILCVDTESYSYLRVASLLCNIKIVLIKAGGPNPLRYFPYCNSLVNFSEENDKHFRKSSKFSRTSLYVIPNRVSPKILSENSEILSRLADEYFLCMRISRIGENYHDSLQLTLDEFKRIRLDFPEENLLLVIIGVVEDSNILDMLQKKSESNVVFLTDTVHTYMSSRFVHYADLYIGCGRSAMEALSLNKNVAIPSTLTNELVFFRKETSKDIAYANFSPRVRGAVANNRSLILENNNFSKSYFNDHLSVERAPELYRRVFDYAKPETFNSAFDILLGLGVTLFKLFRFKLTR